MGRWIGNLRPRVNAAVDWFIPAGLRHSQDTLQGARMFMFSHFFGPFLGNTVTLSMLYLGAEADLSWWILCFAVSGFWVYPILLRLTGWYLPLALVSIEELLFCIFWGAYQYGGMNSPILPWLVTVPLLAFFYLPERSTRIIVAIQIVANLVLFYGVFATAGFQETVRFDGMGTLGLVSTFCASVYGSMMALYFASIVYSQGELEQEIRLHRTTEQQLREATDQAQRALLAKSVFLAKMSHELKNPLNAIIGYSELLIEEAGDADTQKRKDLASIEGAGHRLLGLIDNLLELSKLEAGRVEVYAREIDFADWLKKLAARIGPWITAHQNEWIVQVHDAGRIVCDTQILQRVLEGLVSNAAKHTKNGRVTLSASVRDATWTVSIADTGAGIPPSRMSSLFETFGSSEDETASRYGDEAGLGLPLAYRYCQLMGGQLSVQSEVGVGTMVTVTLPVQPRGAVEPAGVSASPQRPRPMPTTP
ncbi:MAG: HAMP domain-containing sensor histidine kinase [Acidovorax sp.]|uniref:sensor histidine kinase n=1 Tax=Acidovorax sp. TaxID=1872122 RepID=UPI0039E2DFAC